MQVDENCIVIRVGDCRAVVVRGIGIIVPSEDDSISLADEFRASCARKLQHDVLLDRASLPPRAWVRSAVGWVEHDHRARVGGLRWAGL